MIQKIYAYLLPIKPLGHLTVLYINKAYMDEPAHWATPKLTNWLIVDDIHDAMGHEERREYYDTSGDATKDYVNQ